jgi:hypothetical protein
MVVELAADQPGGGFNMRERHVAKYAVFPFQLVAVRKTV